MNGTSSAITMSELKKKHRVWELSSPIIHTCIHLDTSSSQCIKLWGYKNMSKCIFTCGPVALHCAEARLSTPQPPRSPVLALLWVQPCLSMFTSFTYTKLSCWENMAAKFSVFTIFTAWYLESFCLDMGCSHSQISWCNAVIHFCGNCRNWQKSEEVKDTVKNEIENRCESSRRQKHVQITSWMNFTVVTLSYHKNLIYKQTRFPCTVSLMCCSREHLW